MTAEKAPVGERLPTVISALSAVMEEVRAVGKGDRNSQQGYQFRGVDSVVNAVGPVLRKHGVIVMPTGVEANYRDVQTSTGKPSRECTVTARYREAESFTEGTAPHTSARLFIDVPEGTLHAFPGDWVIHIGPGLFSPCTADDFAETYEAVS